MDPHYVLLGNNASTAENIFDRLVFIVSDLKMHLALATAWRAIVKLTWDITLCAGVRFHDGSPMTAEDVAFSIMRPRMIKNSPAFKGTWLVGVTGVEGTGRLTVRVRMQTESCPNPSSSSIGDPLKGNRFSISAFCHRYLHPIALGALAITVLWASAL